MEKKAAAESCGSVCLPDTTSSSLISCSPSQSTHTKKTKVLDTHLPSLKRRRLSKCEDTGNVFLLGNIYIVRSQSSSHKLFLKRLCCF